jgi:hypothetical protein
MASGTEREESIRQAIRYEGNTLHFSLVFHDYASAASFMNSLVENRLMACEFSDATPRAEYVHGSPVLVYIKDYNPDDEGSPSYTSVSASRASLRDEITEYQRIEKKGFIQLFAYRAHVIDNSELKRRRVCNEPGSRDDSQNNRLILSADMHKCFDGETNGVPLARILAVDELPADVTINVPHEVIDGDKAKRTCVWLCIDSQSGDDLEIVYSRCKEGSVLYGDCIYTWVHVRDPELFKENIKWKYDQTTSLWEV